MTLKDPNVQQPEDQEVKTTTPEPTPEEKKAEAKAALAKELGIEPEELESATQYTKRKPEIEKGFRKHFDAKETEFRKKEEALKAKEAELERRLAQAGNTVNHDDSDDRIADIKKRLSEGEMDGNAAAEELDKEYAKRAKKTLEMAKKDTEDIINKRMEDWEQDRENQHLTRKKDEAIDRISGKLAAKHKCSPTIAKAVYKAALDDSGDATEALTAAMEELSTISPKEIPKQQPVGKTKLLPVANKPAGPGHEKGGDHDLDSKIDRSLDSMGLT